MHKGHGAGAGNLGSLKEAGSLFPVHSPTDQAGQLHREPAHGKAQKGGKHQAVNHLDPLHAVNAGKAVVDSDSAAGDTGDQSMAFAGGDTEPPGQGGPDHNGEHGGAEGDQGILGVAAEIHHVVDGFRHGLVDGRHHQNSKEVENRRHNDRGTNPHASGGDAGGNGVGSVGPAVNQDYSQSQEHCNKQGWILRQLSDKIGQRNGHKHPSFAQPGLSKWVSRPEKF